MIIVLTSPQFLTLFSRADSQEMKQSKFIALQIVLAVNSVKLSSQTVMLFSWGSKSDYVYHAHFGCYNYLVYMINMVAIIAMITI